MHLKFRNVNSAFYGLVEGIHTGTIPTVKEESRNGGVLRIDEPVIVTYEKPLERVLFSPVRNCHHTFHLFEVVWMLAGSNQLAPLTYFLPSYKDFSDNGVTVNGAYGYRWRNNKHKVIGSSPVADYDTNIDQLDVLIKHLRSTPNSRRAVLQMWNVEDDLLNIGPGYCKRNHMAKDCPCSELGHDMTGVSKDVCCNLSVCFSIRNLSSPDFDKVKQHPTLGPLPVSRVLDMTVFNRSNDLVWGMLGANVVHFSYLQQYIADCLRIEVGVYNQVSNNLHIYLNNWKPEEWLKDSEHSSCYPELTKIPLVKDKATFDKECKHLVSLFTEGKFTYGYEFNYQEPYLQEVVSPMVSAFCAHKHRDYMTALRIVDRCRAADWRKAGTEWLQRREANYKAKKEA